ncbi:hypothetical protein SKAU_G00346580 [Synaphobranchus kaupii]|uniref:Uncharacterized protein n=1 Tax=Synaphobranchus kaupii TaxID=118154 RepID=A0A9Q1EJN7_SYNKA|nr:hypothetical protein SKAU_G00346580 [Synaphobranchus kaupii]
MSHIPTHSHNKASECNQGGDGDGGSLTRALIPGRTAETLARYRIALESPRVTAAAHWGGERCITAGSLHAPLKRQHGSAPVSHSLPTATRLTLGGPDVGRRGRVLMQRTDALQRWGRQPPSDCAGLGGGGAFLCGKRCPLQAEGRRPRPAGRVSRPLHFATRPLTRVALEALSAENLPWARWPAQRERTLRNGEFNQRRSLPGNYPFRYTSISASICPSAPLKIDPPPTPFRPPPPSAPHPQCLRPFVSRFGDGMGRGSRGRGRPWPMAYLAGRGATKPCSFTPPTAPPAPPHSCLMKEDPSSHSCRHRQDLPRLINAESDKLRRTN